MRFNWIRFGWRRGCWHGCSGEICPKEARLEVVREEEGRHQEVVKVGVEESLREREVGLAQLTRNQS